MTLKELKLRCEKAGIPYAYGVFRTDTEPPHLVAITNSTENFLADNKVYLKKSQVMLDYTYIEKNIEIENKIENEILGDIPWSKTDENYFSDEKYWQVSYFFEVMEEY